MQLAGRLPPASMQLPEQCSLPTPILHRQAIQFDMASFNVSYEGRSTWLTYFSNLRGYVSA